MPAERKHADANFTRISLERAMTFIKERHAQGLATTPNQLVDKCKIHAYSVEGIVTFLLNAGTIRITSDGRTRFIALVAEKKSGHVEPNPNIESAT